MPDMTLKGVMYYFKSWFRRQPESDIEKLIKLCSRLTQGKIDDYRPLVQGVTHLKLNTSNADELISLCQLSIDAMREQVPVSFVCTNNDERTALDHWCCTDDGRYYETGPLFIQLKHMVLILVQHYRVIATDPKSAAKADYYRIKIRPLVLDLIAVFKTILSS